MKLLLGIAVAMAFAAAQADNGNRQTMEVSESPRAVQRTLKRESAGGRVQRVQKLEDNSETLFKAQATIRGKDYTITVREDGTLIVKALEGHEAVEHFRGRARARDDDNGEEEEAVEEEDLPQAVRETIQRETQGASISEIERKQRRGRTIYEVEYEMDGKEYKLMVTEDGTLLMKVLDEEEEAARPERARRRQTRR